MARDLDNYREVGNYYCSANSIANTLINSPFTRAFTMKVEFSQGTSYPCQICKLYDTGMIARRYYDISKWSGWSYFSDDDTVLESAQNMVIPNYRAASESDADNYMDNYSNPLPNDTHYFTNVNLAVVHSSLGGGSFLVEGTKTTNQWEWQKATKYNTTSGIDIHVRTKSNGTWGEWKLIFPSS